MQTHGGETSGSTGSLSTVSPGARSPEPGTRSPEPGDTTPEPGTRSPEPGTRQLQNGLDPPRPPRAPPPCSRRRARGRGGAGADEGRGHGGLLRQDVRHQRPGQQASVRRDVGSGSNHQHGGGGIHVSGRSGYGRRVLRLPLAASAAAQRLLRRLHPAGLWVHRGADPVVQAGRPGAEVQEADLLHAGLPAAAVSLCQPLLPRCGRRPGLRLAPPPLE